MGFGDASAVDTISILSSRYEGICFSIQCERTRSSSLSTRGMVLQLRVFGMKEHVSVVFVAEHVRI